MHSLISLLENKRRRNSQTRTSDVILYCLIWYNRFVFFLWMFFIESNNNNKKTMKTKENCFHTRSCSHFCFLFVVVVKISCHVWQHTMRQWHINIIWSMLIYMIINLIMHWPYKIAEDYAYSFWYYFRNSLYWDGSLDRHCWFQWFLDQLKKSSAR